MRSTYISRPEMGHILAALMPDNRRVMRLAMYTGLRVGDCLAIKTADLKYRMTVRESKTGKTRRVCIPRDLLAELEANAGRIWVFEGRTDPRKHRTRQAVYKDVKRVSRMYQRAHSIRPGQVSPHSARKLAAVEAYHAGGMAAAQRLLNHSDPAVTALYALSDLVAERPPAALGPGPSAGRGGVGRRCKRGGEDQAGGTGHVPTAPSRHACAQGPQSPGRRRARPIVPRAGADGD